MATNTTESAVPPVPNLQEIIEEREGSNKVSVPWMQWFVQLREKVNILNASIVALAGVTGTGFLAKSGASWLIRTITGTSGRISVTNGEGAAGNPQIDLVDTGVVAGSYTNSNLTVGADGRITTITNGSTTGFDPSSTVVFYQDFLEELTSSTASGTSFVTTSSPVVYTASGGSGNLAGSTFGTGIVNLHTNTNSSGYARLFSVGAFISLNSTSGIATIEQRIFTNTASTGTDRYALVLGLIDVISGSTNNRIAATYTDNINSGNWTLSIINAGVSVGTATSVPLNTTSYTILRIDINQTTGDCDLFIDGVLAASATGAPTGVVMGIGTLLTKSVGTTDIICAVDYHYFTRPR